MTEFHTTLQFLLIYPVEAAFPPQLVHSNPHLIFSRNRRKTNAIFVISCGRMKWSTSIFFSSLDAASAHVFFVR